MQQLLTVPNFQSLYYMDGFRIQPLVISSIFRQRAGSHLVEQEQTKILFLLSSSLIKSQRLQSFDNNSLSSYLSRLHNTLFLSNFSPGCHNLLMSELTTGILVSELYFGGLRALGGGSPAGFLSQGHLSSNFCLLFFPLLSAPPPSFHRQGFGAYRCQV